MIAVVTGMYPIPDFHFYMQYNDGTWSHKPGSSGVSNYSLTSGYALTNSNIITRANEGRYSGGSLKFFIITRDGVIDHPHNARDASFRVTGLYDLDVAGDEPNASNYYGIIYGNGGIFDFGNDVDCFYYYPAATGYCTATGYSSQSGSSLSIWMFDSAGNSYGYATGSSVVSFTAYLTSGTHYYIAIWDDSHYQTGYSLGIFATY